MSRHDDPQTDAAANVRVQYEAYPFPLRDPEEESKRLVVKDQESLGKLNHFCFAGRQSFANGFRVLVAGGGTGDHTIFLAEQLRHYDAHVTYIDISQASMDIARERARVRGLENIEWHRGSLEDVGDLGLAPFNLISCTGVLHHLPVPERGLAALRGVLAPDGAMSLMLYGRMGRMAVYAGQELMRLVNEGIDDPVRKTRNARALVQCLPETNWFVRGGDRGKLLQDYVVDENNLYDTLLHEQDCAYSVPEIHQLLAGARLELIAFTSFWTDPPCCRFMYDPMVWITDPALRAHVEKMPGAQQEAIAEAMNCVLTCHGFYAAPQAAGRIASAEDADMVPYFSGFDADDLVRHLRAATGRECVVNYRQNTVQFAVTPYSADLMAGIDGSRSLGELLEKVARESANAPPSARLWQDFMAFYRPLNTLDVLLLRHQSIAAFPVYHSAVAS